MSSKLHDEQNNIEAFKTLWYNRRHEYPKNGRFTPFRSGKNN